MTDSQQPPAPRPTPYPDATFRPAPPEFGPPEGTLGYPWRPVAALVATLLVAGALLGLVWTAWSPSGPAAAFLKAGTQADETEAFIGSDGRFAVLTSVVGILVGVAAWFLRGQRGPVVAGALAVGGLGGSLLTLLVGRLVRGSGPNYDCASETGRCSSHLPLGVQSHGLLFLEAALAVFVYSLFVAFAVADDLGRPDPLHRARRPVVPPPPPPVPSGWAPSPYPSRPDPTPPTWQPPSGPPPS